MSTSVSRETSSGGISTSISRLVLGIVSVGLKVLPFRKQILEYEMSSVGLQLSAKHHADDLRRTANEVPSLRWRVIPVPAVHLQALMLGQNLDGAIPAIVPETFGTIRQSILTAQIGLYLGK